MKLHVVKSSNDSILYFAKSIRIGKKTTTKNIKRIGKLSELSKIYDDPIAHFKDEAKRLTEEDKVEHNFKIQPKLLLDPSKTKKIQLGYVFPQYVYYSLGINDIMRKIHNESSIDYDFNRIVRDLVIGRIIDPLSKCSTYKLAKHFPESPDYELHHIYRALSLIAKNFDFIEEKTFKGMKEYADVNTSVTYYDCTNFYFEIEEEDGFRTYGKSKENRPNPIVQMGLFLDKNGLPISMCINPGKTNEQQTMIPLEEKMKERFGIKKFVVCADCGLSGNKNLKYNSDEDHGFIVTKSLKKAKEEIRKKLMRDDGWKRFGDNSQTTYKISDIKNNEDYNDSILYHDEWFINDKGFEERIIITYSEKTAKYQRLIREQQIQRAMKLIQDGKIRKGVNQNDVKRFINVDNITDNGEVATKKILSINEELFEEESKFDGYYAVTTNLSDPADEIIRINKGRWEIEESFRVMKTEFSARPVYVSREDRIRAHFLTCYLALVVYRVMEQKLIKEGEHYTTQEIISTIRNYQAVDMESFYVGAMEGVAVKALEKTFGLIGSYQAMSKRDFQKLISKSKKI